MTQTIQTPTNLSYSQISWDIREYQAKSGYEILGVEFESRMNNLPSTDNGTVLVPIHCYLSSNHSGDKGAVFNRPGGNGGEYNVSSAYFGSAGSSGDNSTIKNPEGVWKKRTIELFPEYDRMEGTAEDSNGKIEVLGYADGVGQEQIVHVDVMTEIQWSGSYDIPYVDPSDNQTIINFVKTQNGWERPEKVLTLTDNTPNPRDEEHPILTQSEDSWGRYWFGHGFE
jgi:hypothetical protein